MTWNVHACVGTDGRYDPGRIAGVLESLEADVVALQEVDWRMPTHEGRDPLAYLGTRLGFDAVPGPNLRDHRGAYGNGLLSRHPVESVRRIDLARPGREPRGAIDAVVALPSGRLRVIVVHLGLSRRERREQWARLAAARAAGRDPVAPPEATVVLGDLNEWLGPRALRLRLAPDPFPAVHLVRTFPSRLPALALDGLLARPAPLRAEVRAVREEAARRASDHLPVVADVAWTRGGRSRGG